MCCDVCCSLCGVVVCCLSFVLRVVLFVALSLSRLHCVCCLLVVSLVCVVFVSGVRCVLARCAVFVARCLSSVVCCLLSIACVSLTVVCCMLFAVCSLS